ncbi:hypothetical protein P5646_01235 [Bacillus velezensis]|uniref:hypothetical protein n=1 Tax=Bacillus velezensis TaxID=492670 RepID=UPI003D4B74CB
MHIEGAHIIVIQLKIIYKAVLVILISAFFLLFNGWYFHKCIIDPHYYQLTDFSEEDIQIFEHFYNIDLPSNTKFIKAEQFETGIGNYSAILYVSLPAKKVKPLVSDYSYMPIFYNNRYTVFYGVNITSSNKETAQITFGADDSSLNGSLWSKQVRNLLESKGKYIGVSDETYVISAFIINVVFIALLVWILKKSRRTRV